MLSIVLTSGDWGKTHVGLDHIGLPLVKDLVTVISERFRAPRRAKVVEDDSRLGFCRTLRRGLGNEFVGKC